jgi:hypothetical protein
MTEQDYQIVITDVGGKTWVSDVQPMTVADVSSIEELLGEEIGSLGKFQMTVAGSTVFFNTGHIVTAAVRPT